MVTNQFPLYSPEGGGAGGAWKEWWAWRRRLLAEPDDIRLRAVEVAQPLLELLAGRGSPLAGLHFQPMRPCEHWLENLRPWGADNPCSTEDGRLAPLARRWHCHLLLAGEAIVADAQGFHDDQVQVFVSFSFCFAAAAGRPRFFLGSARQSAANETWEVEVLECRVPPRASLPWTAIVAEVVSAFEAGRDLGALLCGATNIIM